MHMFRGICLLIYSNFLNCLSLEQNCIEKTLTNLKSLKCKALIIKSKSIKVSLFRIKLKSIYICMRA